MAYFCSGVLRLQELDLLRHVDYISTVSGGGFIGGWLIANVRRSAHWLGRLTDWKDSISHLRDYSNYLAPRTGILSADTWNLANSWFRNAILIQLTGLATLFSLLLATLIGVRGFLAMGRGLPYLGLHLSLHLGTTLALAVGLLGAAATFVSLLSNLAEAVGQSGRKTAGSEWVKWSAVVPAWIAGFALASHFWAHAQPAAATTWHCISSASHYSTILAWAWIYWWPILGGSLVGFTIIAAHTLPTKEAHAFWIGPFCTAVLYLELAGIFYLFLQWSGRHGLAVVFGPALFLGAFTLCILLLIGFTGRYTGEAVREWWTRYGTWLGVFAVVSMFLTAATLYAPLWLFPLNEHPSILAKIKWSAVAGWVGSVIGSLFAGKSSKTEGTGNSKSPLIELAAKIGGFLFIVGSFILGSTLLYVLLFEIFGPDHELSVTYSDVFLTCDTALAFWQIFIAFVVSSSLVWLFSEFFEINIFGLNQFYRNRLVRCYLGASRWMPGMRKPNAFTGFDFNDDLDLSQFRTKAKVTGNPGYYRGPLPLINCSLNLAGSADLALNTRHSASFTLTPLYCGSDRPKIGYAPTTLPPPPVSGFAGAVRLGQAVAISGAAVSSNMGYNTSPLVAFLLTMFNVRLGWWFPNPSKGSWDYSGLRSSFIYLFAELFGVAGEKRHYLNISDGGHFENLGIYELIRRRCRLIIACDAECDERLEFGGLGNLVRICETDLGATIEIDVKSIRPNGEKRGMAHCAVGLIKYSSGELGRLIYLKASVTGDEDVSILQYASSHSTFPHESTADQFFSEDQFESYRMLGQHIVRSSFKGNVAGDDPLMIAEKMVDVLTPAGCSTAAFLKHSSSLASVWEKFRGCKPLQSFMKELISLGPKVPPIAITDGELCIGLELIQLMEDVFMDLRLDDFWDHPDNRGWVLLFMRWARSPRFRMIWMQTHRTFGIRFEYFCHSRLGLQRDRPIVRV